MTRAVLIACAAAAVAATVSAQKKASAPTDAALVARARAIHERVLTIDTHIDFEPAHFTAACNYTRRLVTQANLPKMRDGRLDVAFFVVQVPQGPLTPAGYADAYRQAVAKFDAVHRLTEQIAPKEIQLALTSADVSRIAQTGREVAVIGIENGYPIGTDLWRVREFHQRGARYMGLAHTGHNQLADSHSGETTKDAPNDGLSMFGREVIAEMNRVGMMVDLSHLSRAAAMQAIALSKAPVIASHSAMRALVDHNRNLDEEQLLALKKSGGVVQVVAYAGYLTAGARSGRVPIRNAVAAGTLAPCPIEPPSTRPLSVEGRPGVKELVDHIDYAVKLIGIDHVGIASDFDGGGGIEGWDSAADTVNVTIELVRRGYSEDDIARLWGRNLLRVWAEVEKLATPPVTQRHHARPMPGRSA
jgi:membrane dipeptidase